MVRGERAVRASRTSLRDFLANVIIDSRPHPQPWAKCIEPWQRELLDHIVPAVEQAAGVRSDYTGPRWFWLTLPRGHDKTGLLGRLAEWMVEFAVHSISGIACASDLKQAGLLRDSVNEELKLTPWLAERVSVQAEKIIGSMGAVDIIPSDAGGASGEKVDLVIIDEITFWKKQDLFNVLFSGMAKRPDAVMFIITNAGIKGSWQWDLKEKCKQDPDNWYVYESPPKTQLASWMSPKAVKAIADKLPRGHAKRVIDNIWVDATEMPLLTEEQIIACEAPGPQHPEPTLWHPRLMLERLPMQPELYIGIDVGRSKDRTVIWTWERVGRIAYTRNMLVLHKTPFKEQREEIEKRITSNVVAVRIDAGGIGSQLAEELVAKYPAIVQGVALNQARQGQLALTFRIAFERQEVRIPPDDDLRADLQQVEEVTTSKGGVPVIVTLQGETGHADRFWAGALGYSALAEKLNIPTSPVGVRYYRPAYAGA